MPLIEFQVTETALPPALERLGLSDEIGTRVT